ncbi:AAA family ATPase [Cyanobium sp. FGCU-6]|nr:AAA family ATPase [Cyanobium sp. FGCU6]
MTAEQQAGSADPRIWIESIVYNDGTEIDLSLEDIVILVGPNNSGKSASLKEAQQLIRSQSDKGKVLSSIGLASQGSSESLVSWLSEKAKVSYRGNPEPTFEGMGFQIYQGNAVGWWNHGATNGYSDLTKVFIHNISTEDRLSSANPTQSIRLTQEPLTHPIHFLQKYDSQEARFSEYFRQAFGTDLIVHRNAGSEVPLYVGDKPSLEEGQDRTSEEYLRRLESLDRLNEQGDGMRSFVGVLLNAFISSHSILFIDEPEAFLHPPQARLLGLMIARDLPSNRQLFIATHSQDFLQGVLEASSDKLKIARIRRDGQLNRVRIINSDMIRAIWSDSLLRHSNILDGLFHDKVIICESDSDCLFYSAMLASITDDQSSVPPDILFVHCGGKHRINMAVRALRCLDVPVSVVADFDVLNESEPLKTIFEELGGNWEEIRADWELVKNAIDQKRPELEASEVRREVMGILDANSERIFPKEAVRNIQRILRKASAWAHAKEVGSSFVPSGDATQAFQRLKINLRSKGLFLVEVGELEGFVRSVGNHGPKWVSTVLERNLKNDPELDNARRFVRELIS